MGQFGEAAAMAVTDQHGDDVDGFGDERARHGHHRFLDELLHPAQRTQCATGMDGADASGMTGAPGFEKIKRLGPAHLADGDRSEEHTSELQSLMRISYAVFCLKKKTHTYITDKAATCTTILVTNTKEFT